MISLYKIHSPYFTN